MKHFLEILPKDKHDFDSVEKIRELGREEIIPLLPGLIQWIQDMNTPIAPKVAELLLDFPNETIPHIRNVFARDDSIWKYWCLEVLVKNLPPQSKLALRKDLIMLAESPSIDEKLEEVDVSAKEILEQMGPY